MSQDITAALDVALPAKLNAFISSLQPGGQPFTTSSFYLPYLVYAPLKAMTNIYGVYRRYGGWEGERKERRERGREGGKEGGRVYFELTQDDGWELFHIMVTTQNW